jgi:hypothetical protein
VPGAGTGGSVRARPRRARRGLARLAGDRAGPAEDPVAVFRSVVAAALPTGGDRGPGCGPDCVIGCEEAGQSRMFQAVPGQVRAVRDFVRLALPGHPAADDTVAVASELAANTVAHSGSGRVEGMFTVHVTEARHGRWAEAFDLPLPFLGPSSAWPLPAFRCSSMLESSLTAMTKARAGQPAMRRLTGRGEQWRWSRRGFRRCR